MLVRDAEFGPHSWSTKSESFWLDPQLIWTPVQIGEALPYKLLVLKADRVLERAGDLKKITDVWIPPAEIQI